MLDLQHMKSNNDVNSQFEEEPQPMQLISSCSVNGEVTDFVDRADLHTP